MSARSGRRLVAGLGTVLALLSLPVFADYQASYRKGMQALDRKNWSGVLEWMSRAARERNTEGGDKINLYGMRFEHYLPHFYMGVAHFESGDPEAAAAEWQISQRQGAIQRTPQNRELQKYLRRLEEAKAAQRRALDEALTATQNEIDRAVAADSEIDRLKQEATSRQVFEEDPSFENDRKSAAELLGSARSGLQRGRKDNDIASVKAAKDQARRARTRLEDVTQRVRQRSEEPMAERTRRQAASLEEAIRAAEAEIDRATLAGAALDRVRQDTIGSQAFQENPVFEQTSQKAQGDLEEARDLLHWGRRRKIRDRVEAARDRAQQARLQFEDLRRQDGQRIGEIRTATARREDDGRRARLAAQQRQAVENELGTLRRQASGLVSQVQRRRSPSAALERS